MHEATAHPSRSTIAVYTPERRGPRRARPGPTGAQSGAFGSPTAPAHTLGAQERRYGPPGGCWAVGGTVPDAGHIDALGTRPPGAMRSSVAPIPRGNAFEARGSGW